MSPKGELDFRKLEKDIYGNATSSRGRYHFILGPYNMEYSVIRSDFGYQLEIQNHAFHMNKSLAPGLPYSVLNVGVGAGLETRIPLHYLQPLAKERPVQYNATNVNTPKEYESPPNELLNGEGWNIDYQYTDGYLLEEEIAESVHNMLLASRVVEWSTDPRRWFESAYKSLAPDGIAIIHTPPHIGTASEYVDPVDLAKQVGFLHGNITVTKELDPNTPILRMLLHKGIDSQNDYLSYVKFLNKKSNRFFYASEPEGKAFTNPIF